MKELIVAAGPNGSGKTTFAEEYLTKRPCEYLSADAIAAELAPDDPTSARFAAGREFVRRLDERWIGNDSFLVESTLSGRTIRRTLQRAKQSGFRLTIVYVFLDSADTCVLRVEQRARKGGHYIPVADVRRRFDRSLANFWKIYRQIADLWVLVYNGSGAVEDVAIGVNDDVSVRDELLYERFAQLVGFDVNE